VIELLREEADDQERETGGEEDDGEPREGWAALELIVGAIEFALVESQRVILR
jgi:hypothetical protein